MQKITILISGVLLLFLGITMIPFSPRANGEKANSSTDFKRPQKHRFPIIQDKNLIKGNWERDDAAVKLHVSKVLKNGGLVLNYLNSKFIFIEKAGWTESSDVLRLFVIFRQDDNPGYSLSLNYLAEKDLLVGVYVDGSDSKSYNVTFRRTK